MNEPTERRLSPKYILLRERIRNDILTGALKPGVRLPHENELMTQFQCSRTPVLRAMSDLVAEGLIERKWGVGTFIKQRLDSPASKALIALIMKSTTGHMHGKLTTALVERLQVMGHQTLLAVYNPPKEPGQQDAAHLIRDVLANKPQGLIVYGSRLFPYAAVQAQRSVIPHLVFMFRNESEIEFQADRVLTDDEHGGWLGAGHLLQLGHRAIAFVRPGVRPLMRNSGFARILEGCQRAFCEHGVTWREDRVLSWDDGAHRAATKELLRQMFSVPSPPTAVFVLMDYIAVDVYDVLRALNLRIPADVAVLGYYNTPWVETLFPALSSISVRETEIGKVAAERVDSAIRNPLQPKETIHIKPELVVRASTGG